MKKVKMNYSTQGSPDGMRVTIYQGGYTYDLPDRLADSFIGIGAACLAVPPQSRKRKSVVAAPENAAVNAAPENAAVNTTSKDDTPKPEKKKKIEPLSVTRVYQLAEELDISSKAIIKTASKIGIYARAPASGLSNDEVKRIKKALKIK